MDQHTETVWTIKLEKLADKIRSNQMEAFIAGNNGELTGILDQVMKPGSTVCCGGSMTLRETGIQAYLNEKDLVYFDREQAAQEGPSAVEEVYLRAFSCDYYLTSTNAITSDGWLVNVDGRGNRVAAMIYGPKNVIVVVGRNKIVDDEEDAWKRIREYAAPVNCVRLSRKTPCALAGSCADCNSPDRICNDYTVIRKSAPKGRIKVILLNYEAGY